MDVKVSSLGYCIVHSGYVVYIYPRHCRIHFVDMDPPRDNVLRGKIHKRHPYRVI